MKPNKEIKIIFKGGGIRKVSNIDRKKAKELEKKILQLLEEYQIPVLILYSLDITNTSDQEVEFDLNNSENYMGIIWESVLGDENFAIRKLVKENK